MSKGIVTLLAAAVVVVFGWCWWAVVRAVNGLFDLFENVPEDFFDD